MAVPMHLGCIHRCGFNKKGYKASDWRGVWGHVCPGKFLLLRVCCEALSVFYSAPLCKMDGTPTPKQASSTRLPRTMHAFAQPAPPTLL